MLRFWNVFTSISRLTECLGMHFLGELHQHNAGHKKDIKVMRVCGLLSNFLCSHFLSSCPNIQGLDISGCLCQNSSQTRRFYTCYVQCVSSLLPLFITWPPLWLSEDGADWQLILSGLTFIPLSCVSPGAPFPRKKNREDFHIVQLSYFSLCPSSMGATPKSGWMLQVSQEHVTNLTELGCH